MSDGPGWDRGTIKSYREIARGQDAKKDVTLAAGAEASLLA